MRTNTNAQTISHSRNNCFQVNQSTMSRRHIRFMHTWKRIQYMNNQTNERINEWTNETKAHSKRKNLKPNYDFYNSFDWKPALTPVTRLSAYMFRFVHLRIVCGVLVLVLVALLVYWYVLSKFKNIKICGSIFLSFGRYVFFFFVSFLFSSLRPLSSVFSVFGPHVVWQRSTFQYIATSSHQYIDEQFKTNTNATIASNVIVRLPLWLRNWHRSHEMQQQVRSKFNTIHIMRLLLLWLLFIFL